MLRIYTTDELGLVKGPLQLCYLLRHYGPVFTSCKVPQFSKHQVTLRSISRVSCRRGTFAVLAATLFVQYALHAVQAFSLTQIAAHKLLLIAAGVSPAGPQPSTV